VAAMRSALPQCQASHLCCFCRKATGSKDMLLRARNNILHSTNSTTRPPRGDPATGVGEHYDRGVFQDAPAHHRSDRRAGTLAAVVTSLVLAWNARRADRTQLRAVANLMTIFHPTIDPKTAPEFLTVSITNQGKWPLRIPSTFFYWKVPFKRGVMLIMP